MILYDLWFRKHGIRRAAQLVSPPLSEIKTLDLPRNSIYHYIGSSSLESGPASDEYILREVHRVIPMRHVVELADNRGNPRHIAMQVDPAIRQYHIQHRRYKISRTMEQALRDPQAPLVVNYAFLHRLYRYMRSMYTEFNRWWNINATAWTTIAQLASETDRHQFLMLKLPKTLPGLSILRIAEHTVSQVTVKVFNNPESMMLLELWKWCGENRNESQISKIALKDLNHVNLIFEESGRWFVMNLGLMNSFRKPTKTELEADPELEDKGTLDPSQFQRRVLRLMITLFQVRTDAAANLVPDTDVLDDNGQQSAPDQEVTIQSTEPPVIDPITGTAETEIITSKLPTETISIDKQVRDQQYGADEMSEAEIDAAIDKELEDLDRLSQQQIAAREEVEDRDIAAPEPITLESGVMKACNRLAEEGLITGAELRRYENLSKSHERIVAPDGSKLGEFIKVTPEMTTIKNVPTLPDIKTVPDKTMLQSTLLEFDSKYIKEVMHRDVAAMVMQIQQAGICVTNYKVEKVEDAVNAYTIHTVSIAPVEGQPSTFHFKLPALEEDGSWTANGIKCLMRKQAGELPIRKVAPNRVSLTSYYGKVFVNRSEKRVNDYGTWLCNAIMAKGLDSEDTTVTDMRPSNVFDNLFVCPRLYSTLASSFRGFTLAGFDWCFEHKRREELYGAANMAAYEQDGAILLGKNKKGVLLLVDKANALYTIEKGVIADFSTMEELLDLPVEKAPVEFAELRVMGKSIPLGIVLGYELGLDRLMRMLNVEPRRVPAGTRLNLASHEYPVVFADETLVFSRDDRLASLFLAGFGEYHRSLRSYSVYEFDRRGVYLNVLEGMGRADRYLREIDLMYQMFVDPITRDLLIEMKEPTDFRGLLVRSAELLLTDYHPAATDPAYRRLKGYERMSGAVYAEIVRSIRIHNGRAGKNRHQLEIKPFAVWKAIASDPSISIINDINPIENLKQIEAVTTGGTGGRNSRSMTKITREYNVNDMGTISEATVDSADVGINTSMSANPLFTSLRGTSSRYDLKNSGATSLLSTSALLSPAADMDDPKRVNFIGIQHSHGIACTGYKQAALRTGYEQVIAHRTSAMFAQTAKKAGKVISVSPTGIIVEFEDGEVKGFELGRRYGSAAGMTIPHMLETDMVAGQTFTPGEVLIYNKGFFEKDILNPKQVVWKAGITVKTVLLESTQTLEDSSAISQRIANLMAADITKIRTVVVNFDQAVHKIAKVGTLFESEDILCTIEDAVTANSNQFDEASLDTLRLLSAQTPQAKSRGVLERIEIFYHGDKEDMSPTLRAAANQSDREFARRNRSAGKKEFTGSVDEGFHVEKNPLGLDQMAIRFYITSQVSAGVGDKGVFGNQMKTVFGEVMTDPVITEDGEECDAVFGAVSVDARIVLSPHVIGTTTTLLRLIGEEAYRRYKK